MDHGYDVLFMFEKILILTTIRMQIDDTDADSGPDADTNVGADKWTDADINCYIGTRGFEPSSIQTNLIKLIVVTS